MRVLTTGHAGYIGSVLAPLLQAAGHEVVGFDTGFYSGCDFGSGPEPILELVGDLREVRPEQLEGFDAIVHLAALSNDPLGSIDPEVTYEINFEASVRLALAAKAAHVPRFLFASSCSLYGSAGDAPLDEMAPLGPITPYAETKAWFERALRPMADDDFSPTYLRNATAHGISPRLRGDLVVHNLVGSALTTGEVLIKSDGSPWRPLIHVEDIGRAFLAVLEAPRELVHDQAFNVGRDDQNFQVRDIANVVAAAVPGSEVVYAPGGEPDARDYRVDFSKIHSQLPELKIQWDLEESVEDLVAEFRRHELTLGTLDGPRHTRLRRIEQLRDSGALDERLRWVSR
ncbi:MAG TPA: SDR family oxidoreductase [Acidimicrobiia bacterium]|nr:SDR family oxidoreductase [Acidimicrobiia bacterium]